MSEHYDDALSADSSLDDLEAAYFTDPSATTLAVAQIAARNEVERVRAEIVAEAERVASTRNSELMALELERDLDARLPDWKVYRDEVHAQLNADPGLLDRADADPAAAARRVELVYRAVKADAIAATTNPADEWYRIKRADILASPYHDSRRSLLNVSRADGGFMEAV